MIRDFYIEQSSFDQKIY